MFAFNRPSQQRPYGLRHAAEAVFARQGVAGGLGARLVEKDAEDGRAGPRHHRAECAVVKQGALGRADRAHAPVVDVLKDVVHPPAEAAQILCFERSEFDWTKENILSSVDDSLPLDVKTTIAANLKITTDYTGAGVYPITVEFDESLLPGYKFSYELLLLNAGFTFLGLCLLRRRA